MAAAHTAQARRPSSGYRRAGGVVLVMPSVGPGHRDGLRRGLGHAVDDRLGDGLAHVGLEDARDDVVRVELLVRDDRGDGVGGLDEHLGGDVGGAGVEQAAEDAGEREHVVDLVRVVAATRVDDGRALGRLVDVDLGVGVGQGEDDAPVGHLVDPLRVEDAGGAHADEHVGTLQAVAQRAGEAARVGLLGELAPGRGQRLVVLVEQAGAVGDGDVDGPRGQEQLHDGRAGGAAARDDDPGVGELLVDDAQRVLQRRQHDDGGAVLVVVDDRDREALAQLGLDLEAARGGDVLEVDPAEAGRNELDRADDLVDVGRVDADGPRVDVGEALEEGRLALHDRQRRLRADVAEAQHRRPVGDHGDRVALDGQLRHVLRVVGERLADPADARRVGHREVLAVAQVDLGLDGDLAAEVQQEDAVGDLVDPHALERLDGGDDLGGVLGVAGRAGEVDDEPVRVRVDDVERRRDAAALGDLHGEGPDDGRIGTGVDPHRDRVGGGGGAGTLDRLSHAPYRPTIRGTDRTWSEDRSVTFVPAAGAPSGPAPTRPWHPEPYAVTPLRADVTPVVVRVPGRAGHTAYDNGAVTTPGESTLARTDGLTSAEVTERVSRGAVNRLTERTSRSVGEIVRANV